MAVKVTVVVPVYNPGPDINDCIRSILGQSLAPGEYEAIFVDDGSTDGTGERLDDLAREHEHIRVIHIPNSGWPGKPRNVGIDNANGEYVYFVDNDDWLAETALENLYKMARRCDSDIVIGRLVGHNRYVPREIFRTTRKRAQILKHNLLALLTPHKLFRRSFLIEHGIRFPEGRRRLEDHRMVVEAYFKAKVISVYTDTVCYHWVGRGEVNASRDRFDPNGYFENLREVLDVVDEHVEPGTERDRFYAHWYRGKMLKRLGPDRLPGYPEHYRFDLYEAIKQVAEERFSRSVEQHLTPQMRVRSHLLREGTFEDLSALALAERGMRLDRQLLGATWEGGVLRLRVSARLTYANGKPVVFTRYGDRLAWKLPVALSTEVPADVRALREGSRRGRLDVLVRNRQDRGDHFLPIEVDPHEEDDGHGNVSFRFEGEATLDPLTAAAGKPLRTGVWDLLVRVASYGWAVQTELARGRHAQQIPTYFPPALVGSPPHSLVPYWTRPRGQLRIDVDQAHLSLFTRESVEASRLTATVDGGAMHVAMELPGQGGGGATELPAELYLASTGPSKREIVTPARLYPPGRYNGDSALTLVADVPFSRQVTSGTVHPGVWELSAKVGQRSAPLGTTIEVAADGNTATRRTALPRLHTRGAIWIDDPDWYERAREVARRIPLLRTAVKKARRAARRWSAR